MASDLRRAIVFAAAMVGAAVLAVAMTPRHYLADDQARVRLEQLVPTSFGANFGDWQVDRTIYPVPPSPDVQRVIDATYDETVARTYRDRAGHQIMLSLAYGRNQHKGMNTHRPEICYPAQGFRLEQAGQVGRIEFDGRSIEVTRLVATQGARHEPITYWLLVGDRITSFGYPQRWAAIGYGVRGLIPDGVLVRASSIERDNEAAFRRHEQFIRDLLGAVGPARRARLIGA